MITADQLVAHAIGDYVLQSDWMAAKKRTEDLAAAVHAFVYSLCFIPFTHGSTSAFAVILGTHLLIDRYGLARYVVWAKNFLAPRWTVYTRPATVPLDADVFDRASIGTESTPVRNLPWSVCTATGYPPDRPRFLAVWLLIIADNVLHVVINGLALRYL